MLKHFTSSLRKREIKCWRATCRFFLDPYFFPDQRKMIGTHLLFFLRVRQKREFFSTNADYPFEFDRKLMWRSPKLRQIVMTSHQCFFCSETTFLFVSSAIKADCNENVWSDKTSPTKCIFKQILDWKFETISCALYMAQMW